MGLRLKIEGSESVNLPETSIERVKFGLIFRMTAMHVLRIWDQVS